MDSGIKQSRTPNPREYASPLSVATFWYTISIFRKGFKLKESDLPDTLSEHKSSKLGNKMEKAWKAEEMRASKAKSTPSLQRVLFKVFGFKFVVYGLIFALTEAIRLNQPLLLGKLLNHFVPKKNDIFLYDGFHNSSIREKRDASPQNQTENVGWVFAEILKFYQPDNKQISETEAYWYAAGIVLCSCLHTAINHPYMMGVQHLGMKMRIGCCSLIYRKSLKLSKSALGQTTAGQLVNLLSNDVNKLDVALNCVHPLLVGPLETIFITYLMYLQVGYSAIVGVGVLFIFIPLQLFLGKQFSVFRLRTALRTDERVRLMNEIISGIQVIKMYAWEKPFAKLVALSRRFEIKSIRMSSYMKSITASFVIFAMRMSIFANVIAYVISGNDITAEKVFVLVSFYGILRQVMAVLFPLGIARFAEARISIGRLNKFMLYDETQIAKELMKLQQEKSLKSEEDPHLVTKRINPLIDIGINMNNASAKWSEASTQNTLNGVSLRTTPGKLIAVIGPVGSGKSSLFHAILQELSLYKGSFTINGTISYASQDPWLFAGSIRQNILFGLPMDNLRYEAVIRMCALEKDFTLLPYGDKTILGDRGVSLSGGQRARINLARAVYKQADIYLLDDPLSAVDASVGKHLFESCISGYLKNKTVILITHQMQYLKKVDHIIYLDNGFVKSQGSFRQLQDSGLDFTKLLRDEIRDEDNEEIKEDEKQEATPKVQFVEPKAPKEVEEQKTEGSVGSNVYFGYFKAGGNGCAISVVLALFIITQILGSMADYFVAYWVNLETKDARKVQENRNVTPNFVNLTQKTSSMEANTELNFSHISRNTSIIIYSVIIGSLIIITLVRSFTFFTFVMRASVRLHDNMFASISRATMSFFNTNGAGRILNRFSKDMGSMDELLPYAMIDCFQVGLTLLGVVIVVAIANPWLIIPTTIALQIFYFLRKVYVRTSINIKRLEGVTRSPVFAHLTASLQGLTTIRAFGAQEALEKEFDNHQDLHSSAYFCFLSTGMAFGYVLDIVCVIYIAAVTFSFLIIGSEKFGGNVGLAITQAIGLTGMFQWGMRQSTELENQMTSVERVLEYNDIELESSLESTNDKKPPETWPNKGKIKFVNVCLRYFPQEPLVLKGVTFTVKPREKVGIVGRTGAGKTSLINALFQLSETQGAIIIDGIDITKIGLHDLRSKISIIPQEPVLFSGTLQRNLDPFGEYTTRELWQVLEDVELKDAIADLSAGLDSKISEGGSNFSVGQRQLICLARAILRNNKILVLDEATANIDPQTDALIQKTIRDKFSNCTVLTIAHRLHTVMDSDQILVMDAGTMKEFDHAYNLLQDHSGIFYGMVQQTGKAMAEALSNVAKESFFASEINKKCN